MTTTATSSSVGSVLLPSAADTRSIVDLFSQAPPDMRQGVVYEFRRSYFVCRHQNHLSGHAELYAQALRDLGAEVRFNTPEESKAFNLQ